MGRGYLQGACAFQFVTFLPAGLSGRQRSGVIESMGLYSFIFPKQTTMSLNAHVYFKWRKKDL